MRNLQAKLPLILAIFLIGLIVFYSINKFNELHATNYYMHFVGVMVVYLLWIILEIKSTTTKELGTTKSEHDKRTLEVYAFGRGLTVLCTLVFPTVYPELVGVQIFGMALFVFSIAFRLYAIRYLGRFYSHRVRIQTEHQIVSDGPYRFLRHPAYTGMIFSHIGLVLFLFNYYAAAVLFLFFIPAVIMRIFTEEKVLFVSVKGYAEYAKGRKRIIPFVW